MREEVKKSAEQLGISYYTIADWRKARSQKSKEERIASDKTPLNERELTMQQEIQELKKLGAYDKKSTFSKPQLLNRQGIIHSPISYAFHDE